MADQMWYYADGSDQKGPLSWEQLWGLAQDGTVRPDQLVWTDGMANWLPAAQIPTLVPAGANAGAARPAAYATPYGQPGGGPGGGQIDYYTPDNTLAYGGFWIRVGAYLIDYLILLIPTLGIGAAFNYLGMSSTNGGQPTGASIGIGLIGSVINIVIVWLYNSLQVSGVHQATIGKRTCGLVVTDLEGRRLSFGHATGRYFAKILSGLILCIGFMMVGWTQRKQGLHDMVASTLVMRKG